MCPSVELWQRRLNPLIDKYVTTDIPLQVILASAPQPRHPVVEALLRLELCLDGKVLPNDAMSAAKDAPTKRCDSELLALMLARWTELNCRVGKVNEAEELIQSAKELVGPKTHPVVRADVLFAESTIADITGRKDEREKVLLQIAGLLSAHVPRRKFYVWEYCLFMAQQGRGAEYEDEMRELSWQCNESFKLIRLQMVKFVDAVECGRILEASQLLPQIVHDMHAIKKLAKVPWRYEALLKLMQQHMTEKEPLLAKGGKGRGSATWLRVLEKLLADDTEEALKLARREASRSMSSLFGASLDSFNQVRAELACGNWEEARKIITRRHERGNKHYLDDFFLARCEVLAGNRKAAARHFASALDSVERAKARGRLDFELRLARELSEGDIVQLTRAAVRLVERARARGAKPSRAEPGKSRVDLIIARASRGTDSAGIKRIIGKSEACAQIRDAITKYADLETSVLITGETGTGKDLVARVMHEASARRDQPYIPVNCGAISETLLESELFGHERGAFTGADRAHSGLFEDAKEGTIFLDEIGDISPRLQAALLRVLETGEIRPVGSTQTRRTACRVIAATNADLGSLVENQHFRKDLLFRLQRLVIHIPPLRERRDDIMMLVRGFMDHGRQVGTHAQVSKDLRASLLDYDWPGNVRELKNVVERMRLMNSDKLVYSYRDLDLSLKAVLGGKKEAPVRNKTLGRSAGKNVRTTEDAVDKETAPGSKAEKQPGHRSDSATAVKRMLGKGKSQIRRLDALRCLFRDHDKLTRSEVIELMGVSPNTATKDLKALCAKDEIERIEPSASTRSHYFVTKNLDIDK